MIYREAECLACGHKWEQPVQMSAHTSNLSGEARAWCPQCNSGNVVQGPHQTKA